MIDDCRYDEKIEGQTVDTYVFLASFFFSMMSCVMSVAETKMVDDNDYGRIYHCKHRSHHNHKDRTASLAY
jgi:hypothetical protein